jgi:lipopolysaccharide export LptBFGC system permease protein LptF
MDQDMKTFLIIVLVAIAIVVVFAYLVTKARDKKYIIFANNTQLKTKDGSTYNMDDITNINYINNYIIGKGTESGNIALHFYFSNGKAVIDRRSNIYEAVYNFVEKLDVPKKVIVTKGLIKETKS